MGTQAQRSLLGQHSGLCGPCDLHHCALVLPCSPTSLHKGGLYSNPEIGLQSSPGTPISWAQLWWSPHIPLKTGGEPCSAPPQGRAVSEQVGGCPQCQSVASRGTACAGPAPGQVCALACAYSWANLGYFLPHRPQIPGATVECGLTPVIPYVSAVLWHLALTPLHSFYP